MKKAQGMSMNVIIIAVIALIILVVLVMIFTGKTKMFGKTTSDTAADFTGSKCKVPGTNSECSYSQTDCDSKGGSYSDNGGKGYTDCNACCRM